MSIQETLANVEVKECGSLDSAVLEKLPRGLCVKPLSMPFEALVCLSDG